jgi:hypothetical protein
LFTVYIVNNFIYFVKGFDVKNKHFYLPFERVHICTVSDALHVIQHPAAAPICPTWAVWYRVRTGASCLAWSALVSGTACAVQSCPVRWMGQGRTVGVYRESLEWGGEPSNHRKNKKGSKITPTPISSSQKFSAKTKRPLQRVWLLCYTCLTSLEREESTKMYALFGMIALVATPVFGALCLYNKATHKKDNRMLIAFFVSFAVLVICLAVTPEPSHDESASSGVTSSSAKSTATELDDSSIEEVSESSASSTPASQKAASESERPISSEPASSEQVASSASSHNPDDDILMLDLDDYAKQAADNAVKAKDKYAGKQYKVTYQVNSVSDAMIKLDNPYTVMFSVNFVTSHSIGYTVYMAGFPENEKDKISMLSPGQTVTFVGDFDGNKFTDCRFIVP